MGEISRSRAVPSGDTRALTWRPVGVTVDAKVGPVTLRLFEYDEDDTTGEGRPWCWGAMCRVTFRFDGRWTTRKRLTERFDYRDHLGWPKYEKPSEGDLRRGRETVLTNIRTAIEAHGVTVGALDIREEAHA